MRSVASVALFLIAAFALPAHNVSQTPPDNDRRELMHLEDVWNQAHVAGDAEALDHLWADDLEVAVPHMAVMTRAEALGFALSGRMRFLSYETSDLHIRVYGDAAVVIHAPSKKTRYSPIKNNNLFYVFKNSTHTARFGPRVSRIRPYRKVFRRSSSDGSSLIWCAALPFDLARTSRKGKSLRSERGSALTYEQSSAGS